MDDMWARAIYWSTLSIGDTSTNDGEEEYELILNASHNMPQTKQMYSARVDTHWREYVQWLYDNRRDEVEAELIKMRLADGHD